MLESCLLCRPKVMSLNAGALYFRFTTIGHQWSHFLGQPHTKLAAHGTDQVRWGSVSMMGLRGLLDLKQTYIQSITWLTTLNNPSWCKHMTSIMTQSQKCLTTVQTFLGETAKHGCNSISGQTTILFSTSKNCNRSLRYSRVRWGPGQPSGCCPVVSD